MVPAGASHHKRQPTTTRGPLVALARLQPACRGMWRAAVMAWHLFLTVLKRRLSYRGDLAVQALDEIMRGLVALVMLQVYMAKTTSLNGWSADEMLFILGFAMIPLALFHCFCGNLYRLSSYYLIEGHFDRVLLRPYPAFLQVCLDGIAIEDLSGAILGGVLIAIAINNGAVAEFGVFDIALMLVLIVSSFAIVVAVFMAFAASSFWFEDRVGMVPPIYNLMEFGRWPVAIYNNLVRVLVTLLIPFSFTAFYPASLFLETGHAQGTWLVAACTPLVAAVALSLAIAIWRAGVRRYGSTGS